MNDNQTTDWRGDHPWLTSDNRAIFTRDGRIHVVGGMDTSVERDPDEDAGPDVMIAWLDPTDGKARELRMEAAEARHLAAELLNAASAAEAQAYGDRSSSEEILEERRLSWNRTRPEDRL